MRTVYNIFLTVLSLFVVAGMCIAALCVEAFLALCDCFMWCCETAHAYFLTFRYKFNKTAPALKGLRNMILSKYELSFQQETLFNVRIKTDKDAIPKQCWMVGKVRRGSFDFELEPIKYDHTTCIEKIELSHMSLPAKTMYGPIHMMVGDVLKVSYGKKVGHTIG